MVFLSHFLSILVFASPCEGCVAKLAWAGFMEVKSSFMINKRFRVFR